MKRWSMLAIGAGVYALVLVATVPATLVDAGLQRASNGRLRLAEAGGTLWSGAGQLEIRDAGGQFGFAKHVAWRLRPGASFRAPLAYEIAFGSATRPFPLTIFWSRIELANADIHLPAAALGLGVPKLAVLELTGDVNLHVASFSMGRSATRGSATLQWLRAGSAFSPVSPLGDYELRFDGKGPAVHATLHTLQGPLQLDGRGSWAAGRRAEFLATANMPPRFRQRLEPFLRLIAVERGDGSYRLQLD
jgi:general secretion pathway protein N